jgi:hypothetical protein
VSELDFADMEIIRRVTEEARESMFVRSRERLQNKFKILVEAREAQNRSNDARPPVVKAPILNLAPAEVPKNHLDLLSLGPKFVPNPTRIPYMDIITVTESSALKLEYQKKTCEAQVLRKDVLRIMKTARLPKDNLSPDQRQALREINNDQNLRIYPFDKGTGLVRIEHEEAIRKIREQLGDTEVVQNDPTNIFAKEIRTALSKLNKKGRFTKKEYEEMYPSDAIPPRMYGTIKAHKPEKQYPMRLVVSTIGTPPHGISAYLVKIIQHTLNKNPTRLKNSTSFVEMARNWNISPTEVQVSFDVINLYPSVPLKEATKVILDLLKEDPSYRNYTKLKLKEIKEMIELCISRCYFIWNEEIHVLKDSGPIGLSIMVVLAEGFLQVLESKALNEALREQPPYAPITFYRYVDDSHSRFYETGQPGRFLNKLNQQDERVQYTMEVENAKKELNYLEIKTINKGTGKYEFDVFRKAAITNVQVKPNSSHDPNILKGIFKGFLKRANTICSDEYLEKEIEFLVEVFVKNGYKRENLLEIVEESKLRTTPSDVSSTTFSEKNRPGETITLPWIPGVSPRLRKVYKKAGYKVAFKSGRNIGDMLTSRNKSKLPGNSHPGIYKIPCSCGKTPYRGETKKRVMTRVSEHEQYIAKEHWSQSGIALHAKNCAGEILFDQTETVAVIPERFKRKVRETLEIQKYDCHVQDGGMNPDKGQYVKTNFWYPMLKYLKRIEETQRNGRL